MSWKLRLLQEIWFLQCTYLNNHDKQVYLVTELYTSLLLIIFSLYLGELEFCLEDFPSNYSFNEFATEKLTITLYGVPPPTVQWKFHDDEVKETNHTTINSYTYQDVVTLPKLTQEMCGKKPLFNATGYNNSTLMGNSSIFLNECKNGNLFGLLAYACFVLCFIFFVVICFSHFLLLLTTQSPAK